MNDVEKTGNAWSRDMTPSVRGLGEVGAHARHGVGEVTLVHGDERALFRPDQLFVPAIHLASCAPFRRVKTMLRAASGH